MWSSGVLVCSTVVSWQKGFGELPHIIEFWATMCQDHKLTTSLVEGYQNNTLQDNS